MAVQTALQRPSVRVPVVLIAIKFGLCLHKGGLAFGRTTHLGLQTATLPGFCFLPSSNELSRECVKRNQCPDASGRSV
eukprot:scaffold249406_cov33-Tisochrysis_lutea.AAC.3